MVQHIRTLTGQPISETYAAKLEAVRLVLDERRPVSERLFESKALQPLSRELDFRYERQTVFTVAEGIAFIPDFYIPEYRLLIEIDGRSHQGKLPHAKDSWRDTLLDKNIHLFVARFANAAVRLPELLGDLRLAVYCTGRGLKSIRHHPEYKTIKRLADSRWPLIAERRRLRR